MMKTLSINEAERFFRAGGTVTRHYRNMPATFETAVGIITRQAVNVLYQQDKLRAERAGRLGATYRWAE